MDLYQLNKLKKEKPSLEDFEKSIVKPFSYSYIDIKSDIKKNYNVIQICHSIDTPEDQIPVIKLLSPRNR